MNEQNLIPFSFVMLGAQKSASSFLHLCIAEHPGVFMPHGELPFFESPDYKVDKFPDFLRLFDAGNGKVLGFRRATYLGLPEVAGRLKHHAPDCRLIAVLRHPVERAISSYYHNMATGFIPVQPIEAGIRAIIEGRWQADYPRAAEVVEFSHYRDHLERYRHVFCDDQILCLLHDDCVDNPLACVQKIYSFIGVTNNYVPMALSKRPQAALYSIPRLRFRSILNGLKYQYSPDHTRLDKRRGGGVRSMLLQAGNGIDQVVLSRVFKDQKPRLSVPLRQELLDLFSHDVRYVEGMLDRELPSWKV